MDHLQLGGGMLDHGLSALEWRIVLHQVGTHSWALSGW